MTPDQLQRLVRLVENKGVPEPVEGADAPLQEDPAKAMAAALAWLSLGCPTEGATIDGVVVSRLELGKRALQADPTNELGWQACAARMAGGDSFEVEGKGTVTMQMCCVEALASMKRTDDERAASGEDSRSEESKKIEDTRRATLWTRLGCQLSNTGSSAEVSGETVNSVACFTAALNIDDETSSTWYNAATELADQDMSTTITVKGKAYNAAECCVQCLDRDPTSTGGWTNLTYIMNRDGAPANIAVQGKAYDRRGLLVRGVELDPKSANAWDSLGCALGGQETLKVTLDGNDVDVTARDCHAKAAELDGRHAIIWMHLAFELKSKDKAEVGGVSVTKKDCIVKAISLDQAVATAQTWDSLGCQLQAGDTVDVAGTTYKGYECHAKAVDINAGFHRGWMNLALELTSAKGATATVGGNDVTAKQAYEKALETAPALDENAKASAISARSSLWDRLGNIVGATDSTATVGGKEYTQMECIMQALGVNPKQGRMWGVLGLATSKKGDGATAVVDGKTYAVHECFAKAVDCDSSLQGSWSNLAATMPMDATVTVAGAELSKGDVMAKILQQRPTDGRSWEVLGRFLKANGRSVKVPPTDDGVDISGKDAFAKAVTCSRQQQKNTAATAQAWLYLAMALLDGEHVTVDMAKEEGAAAQPQECTRLTAYAQALAVNPAESVTWFNLGIDLGEETVDVPGEAEPVTRPRCFARAVAADPKHSRAWFNLGCVLAPKQTEAVAGVEMNRKDCFAKAIEADPKYSMGWVNLATQIAPGETFPVNGAELSAVEVLQRCLEIDANCSQAWRNVGELLTEKGATCTVAGEAFTKDQCLERSMM